VEAITASLAEQIRDGAALPQGPRPTPATPQQS
jgi:hypothetical protein